MGLLVILVIGGAVAAGMVACILGVLHRIERELENIHIDLVSMATVDWADKISSAIEENAMDRELREQKAERYD